MLLLLLHLGRQVSKGGIAVESTLGLGAWCTSSLHHQPANLLLKRIILFFKLVVLFLDSEVVLNLLGLIVVADVHLLASHAFELFFESLLLICEGLQSHDDLLNLILSLLEHLFLLAHLTIEAFPLSTALLFVAPGVFNLPVLDLNQLAQILILFL